LDEGGIGGYHTVELPLSESAKRLISDFNSGANFVELKISESKDSIEGVRKVESVSLSSLQPLLNSKDARFYLIASRPSTYLLYLCPEDCPINNRMVYSTAKSSICDAVKACGVNLTRILEATDVKDIDSTFFQRPVIQDLIGKSLTPNRYSQEPEWVRNRREKEEPNIPLNASKDKMTEPHITAQIVSPAIIHGNSGSGSSIKKKIVIPPQGAW